MATILQFAERLAEHGDWTPAERSQLRDMSSQLGQNTAGLDLVFGKTEEGDPWCVVADDRSEVLLHVARIQGNFVVHAPRNDQVIESHDLWLAVSRVLGGVLRDRRGVVLPFAPEIMGQPAALALMLAAAVRGDFTEIVRGALPQIAADNDLSQAPALAPPARSHEPAAAEAARHGAPAEAAHATDQGALVVARNGGAAVAVAAASGQAEAGPLDGRAVVTAQASAQVSGDAAPAVRTTAQQAQLPAPPTDSRGEAATAAGSQQPPAVAGGAPNGHDFSATVGGDAGTGLAASGGESGGGMGGGTGGGAADASVEGGLVAQSERLVAVQSGGVAEGQTGASDAFVLTAPARLAGGNVVSLGVVSNFAFSEGDRLVFANGLTPRVVDVIELQPMSLTATGVNAEAGRRIGYDTNGDGREDAFVVVLDAPQPLLLQKAADISIAPDHTVSVQGVAAPVAAAAFLVVFIGQ